MKSRMRENLTYGSVRGSCYMLQGYVAVEALPNERGS
jgi:hypothetical protein